MPITNMPTKIVNHYVSLQTDLQKTCVQKLLRKTELTL
jgi:hypothetical protein